MAPYTAHMCVSPDGDLAYLPVHKCASTTYNFHFQRRLGWGRAWPADAAVAVTALKDYVPDPDPSEILVITRDPVQRWVSGMKQIDFWTAPSWGAVPWDDPHLWPVGRFLSQWPQFGDRFVFHDMNDVDSWLSKHGLPSTEDHLNRGKIET